MRLLLIRHGQTPSNVAGELDTGFPGAGLTGLGVAQARAVPAALAGEAVHGLYASPLVRTQLTAAPLGEARGLEVRVRPGLEEVSAGDLEMRSDEDAVEAYIGCLAAWIDGDLGRAVPGGPDGRAFLRRFDDAVRAIAAGHGPADTVVAFSHGAAMRTWTALRTGIDGQAAAELRIMNTGMGVLDGDPDAGWRLLQWHHEPLGGLELEDAAAHDVTGESQDEAVADAQGPG